MRPNSALRCVAVLSAMMAGSIAAQGPSLSSDPVSPMTAFARVQRAQAQLVHEAESTYHARVVATLPGWAYAVKDAERRVRKAWRGLAPVVLLVPDAGRGFPCDDREDTCLGRYQGAEITVQGSDSAATVISSVILLAESARWRSDVWAHELTHALLSQHGMVAESLRHDRRYFTEERFVRLEF